jgi:hypothetical protein
MRTWSMPATMHALRKHECACAGWRGGPRRTGGPAVSIRSGGGGEGPASAHAVPAIVQACRPGMLAQHRTARLGAWQGCPAAPRRSRVAATPLEPSCKVAAQHSTAHSTARRMCRRARGAVAAPPGLTSRQPAAACRMRAARAAPAPSRPAAPPPLPHWWCPAQVGGDVVGSCQAVETMGRSWAEDRDRGVGGRLPARLGSLSTARANWIAELKARCPLAFAGRLAAYFS